MGHNIGVYQLKGGPHDREFVILENAPVEPEEYLRFELSEESMSDDEGYIEDDELVYAPYPVDNGNVVYSRSNSMNEYGDVIYDFEGILRW